MCYTVPYVSANLLRDDRLCFHPFAISMVVVDASVLVRLVFSLW